ncbi:MAG: ATPase [Sphingomicrobium sp.]
MPQLNQLSEVVLSQLFWLAVVLSFIYFAIGRGMVPRIQATVDQREGKIASDLERAQEARKEADETEAAWRARMDAARRDAARIAQEAKQEGAQETEAKVKAAADKITLKVEAAQSKVREALQSARAEIESVAVEATQDMVARLTSLKVDRQAAADAVKAELNV